MLPRYSEAFDIDLRDLVTKLVMSLQGDDEANAGQPADGAGDEVDWEEHELVMDDPGVVAHISSTHMGMDWDRLKQCVSPPCRYGRILTYTDTSSKREPWAIDLV